MDVGLVRAEASLTLANMAYNMGDGAGSLGKMHLREQNRRPEGAESARREPRTAIKIRSVGKKRLSGDDSP